MNNTVGKCEETSIMLSIKIQQMMIEKRLNKKQLAERCGWSQSNLYNKLKRDNFSEEDLIKISKALECKLEINFIPE